jgi:hypothetical protein
MTFQIGGVRTWTAFGSGIVVAAIVWIFAARWSQRSMLVIGEMRRKQGALVSQERKLRENHRAPEPAPPAPLGPRRVIRSDEASDLLMQKADLQVLYFTAQKASLGSTYGPLFRALKLSPAQMERLEQLILLREQSAFDVGGAVPEVSRSIAGRRSSLGPDPTTISAGEYHASPNPSGDELSAAQLLKRNADSFHAEAAAVLGDEGFSRLEQFERALPVEPLANAVVGALASGDSPASVEQSDQLLQILAEASVPYQKGKTARQNSIDWKQARSRAAGVLTPAQMTLFQFSVGDLQASKEFHSTLATAAKVASPAGSPTAVSR